MCVSLQSARCEELHLHAENLSRRVWELLMLLPTCPKMLLAFQNISDDTVCPDPDTNVTKQLNIFKETLQTACFSSFVVYSWSCFLSTE